MIVVMKRRRLAKPRTGAEAPAHAEAATSPASAAQPGAEVLIKAEALGMMSEEPIASPSLRLCPTSMPGAEAAAMAQPSAGWGGCASRRGGPSRSHAVPPPPEVELEPAMLEIALKIHAS